jgi:hypothetical protein
VPGINNPNRIGANYTPIGHGGAGGDSPGAGGAGGTGNPLGTSMGNNAAANVGMSGLLSAISGIPAAMQASGMGMSGSGIANAMLGNTAMAMFGPMGIANSLLGTAYSGYQASKAATDLNMGKTGIGSQAAFKSLSSPFGILGMIPGMFSSKAQTAAMAAAAASKEGQTTGLWGGTDPSNDFGQAWAANPQESPAYFGAQELAKTPQSPYVQSGIPGRYTPAMDMTAIGGRFGGVIGHQGDPVGGNQSGDPGVGVGYGGGFGEEGSPTGQAEGDY